MYLNTGSRDFCFCCLFNDAVTNVNTMSTGKVILNHELEGIWKEKIVA
jgi:hypothetical protein